MSLIGGTSRAAHDEETATSGRGPQKQDSIEAMVVRRIVAGDRPKRGRPVYLRVLQAGGLGVLLLVLWPSLTPVFRPVERIMIDQVRGKGCLVRDDCELSRNPLAWQTTRAPEFRCPMMAAKCLARGKVDFAYRREALAAIDEAMGRLPELFDTGDGVILFGHEMRRARESIASGGRVIYDIFKQ